LRAKVRKRTIDPRMSGASVTAARPRLLLFLVCAVAVAVRCLVGPYIADDAYITFRYSENLAAGRGFTYNPPDRVQGTTAPLAALALAPAARLHADPGWTMLAVSSIADVVTIVSGATLLARAGWPVSAALFAVAFALWPGVLRYSVSGLETSLYVALIVSSFLLADLGRGTATGITLALASLCRPDGALAAAVIIPFMWWRRPKDAYAAAAACALLLLPWAVFALAYFHTIVPASVAAKAHTRLPASESLHALLLQFSGGIYTPLTAIAAVGAWSLARRGRPVLAAIGVWWVLYAAIFVATGAFGPYPWYFVPLLPAYLGCIAAAVEQVLRLAFRGAVTVRVTAGFVGLAGIALATRVPSTRATLDSWFTGREYLYREVATTVLMRQDCTLAATEIGALGYFYRGRVLDLVGLVSPEVTRQSLKAIFAAQQPCWVVSYDTHLPPQWTSGEISAPYRVVFRRRVAPGRELLVFARQ
jgi:hypothetical protein